MTFPLLLLPHPRQGDQVLFLLDFFVSLFLCQQHYEKTAGPICMKFSGKVWSDHGTICLNFGSIRVNGSAGQGSICYHRPQLRVSCIRQGAGFVVPCTTVCYYYYYVQLKWLEWLLLIIVIIVVIVLFLIIFSTKFLVHTVIGLPRTSNFGVEYSAEQPDEYSSTR